MILLTLVWRALLFVRRANAQFILALGMLACIIAVGCQNPALEAVKTADAVAVLQKEVAPVLKERCIEPIDKLTDAQIPKHREKCDPPMAVYGAVRTSHIALRAALLAYAARAQDRATLMVTITRLVFELGLEALKLSQAIEVLK